MKTILVLNLFHPISVFALSVSLAGIFLQSDANVVQVERSESANVIVSTYTADPSVSNAAEKADILYKEMDLAEYGLSKQAFSYAYKGYQHLLEKNRITNSDYLTICDFSKSSGNKRLFIIDLEEKEVFLNTYVAHGRNSGKIYATRFSNKPESLQSSLGFFVTKGTYYGSHGLSLNLEGVENGINNNAYQRRIVMHGADYVSEKFYRQYKYMGRSFGCPAVPQKESSTIINTIKDGTCLFIYHPTKKYTERSKILNS